MVLLIKNNYLDLLMNNTTILKNTLLLYVRMILVLLISLYTSRIVLEQLGVTDFGIYSVVGGVVTMLSFFNSSMSSATQRFISFELGKKNIFQLTKVFSLSVIIHFIIAIGVLILAETIGLWVVNNLLTIPEKRLSAANWVYQFSVITFIINIISVPYNAAIIAHERMNVFAYIGVFEVVLKLLLVYSLDFFGYDKLKLYAVLICIVSLIIRLTYGIYTNKKIKACKFTFIWDRKLFNTLFNYAGWNLWGNIAVVTYNQGINILLNIYFGPIVNASRELSFQVNSALNKLTSGFQTAMNPQIVKNYASKNIDLMHNLILRGSKFSFFLVFIISVPLFINTHKIIFMWLGIIPEYSIIFVKLLLINSLINSLSGPLMTGAQASGNIKLYQLIIGGLLLMILPFSYFLLEMGYSPEITLYVSIFFGIVTLFARIILVSNLIDLSKKQFLLKVIIPVFKVFLTVLFLVKLFQNIFPSYFQSFILSSVIVLALTCTIVFYIGLNKIERNYAKNIISNILK